MSDHDLLREIATEVKAINFILCLLVGVSAMIWWEVRKK